MATNICLGPHSGNIVSFIMMYTMNAGREKTTLKNSNEKWRQHCVELALPVLPPKTQIYSLLILLGLDCFGDVSFIVPSQKYAKTPAS